MVRTKGGGGSCEKQERGEGEASREGGGTYWVGSETGKAVGGQRPRRDSSWWALASPRRRRSWWWATASPRHRHPFSFCVDVVLCCPSCPSFVRVLAVERSWAVDAGGVALAACVRPVVARGGRAWFLWALVVVCALSCCLRVVVLFAHCHVVCTMSCRLHDVVSFARFRVFVAVVVVLGRLGSCQQVGLM